MKQIFKHEVLTQKKCVNSILRFYDLASASETIEGLHWYDEANKYCRELSSRFNITLSQAAGIIAVFSPQAGWEENKRYALSFLLNPKIRLRSLVQVRKAKKILSLTSETDIYNALSLNDRAEKTKAFFLNILNPDLVTDVTIDRHAIASCIQRPDETFPLSKEYGNLTPIQYQFFERCYVVAASELNLLPQQLQAIVWVTYRRIRDLKQHTGNKDWQPFTDSDENPF